MVQRRLRPATLVRCINMATPILIETAKASGTITYYELMGRMGGSPGRGYIGEVLETIADTEREAHRPKLTAVVVTEPTGAVSGGFFGLKDTPAPLKRTTPEEWQDNRLSKADRRYWQEQLEILY